MKNPVRVLCVQSFPDHVQEIISLLRDGGYEPSYRHVSTLEDFQSVISVEPWDIILCDYRLTDCDVLQVLLEREAAHVEAPLIVLAQDISCEYVAAAMRAGAADCVARSNLSGLFTVIQRELRRSPAKKTRSEADGGVKAPALTDLDLERRQRELHRLNVMLRDEIAIRRQAEDALRESEERFRVMADNTPVIIWVHDPDGRVQFVNRSYCEFFGVSERELKAKGWQMVVHPDDVASVADGFMESLRNQTSFHATARVRRYDGQWRWVESYGEPRFSSAHVFLGIAGSSVDITERMEAEKVLATHVKDLMFLSRSATGLLEPMSAKALFDYVARHLHTAAGDAIIVVSEYDAPNNRTIVRAIAGPEEKTRKVERLLGRDLVGLALPVAEGTVQRMIAGNLAHVGGGLFDLSFGQIPKPVCVELEQELSLGRIYAMPFALDPDFLGTVAVLTDRAEGLKNRSVIEACVNQAGLALKRQRAEQALRESEKRYRSLVTHAPAGIYEIDFRTRKFTSVNEEMSELLGYSRQELLAINPFDILDEPGKLRFQERINRWLAGEKVDKNVEYRITAKDGRVIYVLLDVTFTADESGQPVGATVIGHDITERKQIEEALAAATRRLEAHLANSPLAIIEFDGSFVITRWSREAEAIFGWSSVEVLGKRIGDFPWVHEDDVERVAAISREMLEGKKPSNMHRNRNYRKDGTVVHCEWYTSAIRDTAGELTSVFSQVLDITARERAEESLQANKEQLSAILLQAPVGIAVFDHDGNIVTSNELWTRLIPGKMPAPNTERNWRAWGPDGRLLETSEFPSTRALRGETISPETDFMYTAADGTEVWVRVGAAPLHSKSGEIVGGIAVVQEVSALKRIEQALKENEERFRLMADSAPVPIWVSGLQGTGFVNRAYREFVGLAGDVDMADFDWTQYVHPEDHDTYLHTYLACFEQRAPFEAVFRFRRHDGVYRWVKSVGQPRFSASGEFEGYVGCTVDITDVKVKEGRKLEDEVLDR